MDPKKLGRRIARLRAGKGWNQPALVRETKNALTQPSLSVWEDGFTKDPKARTLIAISRALGTTVEYLWDCENEPETGDLESGDAETLQALEAADQEAQLIGAFRQLDERGRRAVLEHALREQAETSSPTTPSGGAQLRVVSNTQPEIQHPPEVPVNRTSLTQRKDKKGRK